ncbi:MAG TPA: MaoC family dehydratase [Solirubrobacteraceae bacterium]|jgi:acyl dehydratase|nr:MaoC family dehydratase [Solirubrobacteraceae bacterium]
MLTAATIEELRARAGEELGASEFRAVTQEQVDGFAALTGDHQWIHTDPERARSTPFGGTIVHGYFTVALAPVLLAEVLPLDGFAMALNYGLDKLRFPAPLPVGERVRMHVRLDDVQVIPTGGATLALTLTFEREGADKPVCVASALYRVFEAS